MTVYIVTATYRNGRTHVVEAFDSNNKAVAYLRSDEARMLYGDAELNIVWRQVK